MTDPLSGARLKLARAEEHFSELGAAHQGFLERNPYRALREADTYPSGYLWRIKIVEEPPFGKWAAIVGDCVHALRAALDHVAYELVRINRPADEYAEFPIFREREKWVTDHAQKLPGVDPRVVTMAKWLQPYRREEDADWLWIVLEPGVLGHNCHLFAVDLAAELLFGPVSGDEAGSAQVGRRQHATAGKCDRLIGGDIVAVAEELDLDAHAADPDAPAPAVELRFGLSADRFERVLEGAEVSVGIDAEGDMNVGVGRSEVSGDRHALAARQDLGYKATQDDERDVLAFKRCQQPEKRFLGEGARLG